MSYARWGADGSDVYVFATYGKDQILIECCGCNLEVPRKLKVPYKDIFGITHEYEDSSSFYAKTSGEIIRHLEAHKLKGHTVLDRTIEKILAEYPDQDAVMEFSEQDLEYFSKSEERNQRILDKMRQHGIPKTES